MATTTSKSLPEICVNEVLEESCIVRNSISVYVIDANLCLTFNLLPLGALWWDRERACCYRTEISL